MNNFEQTFFKKYVAEWQEIIEVFHRHSIKILDDLILWFGLWVLIPVFVYYNSIYLQKMINFTYFEIYLILVYVIIIYKILDWYNDVLILTDSWVVRLEWSLFKSSSQFADYEHIEWVWVEKNWFLDTILQKWDLIIHKFWEEEIILDEASKPYKIVDKIESITSQIEKEPEIDKFDLMMDTLWTIVQNFLSNTNQKKEDIFESPHSISPKGREVKYNLKQDLQEDLVKKVKEEDGTIDLR